MQSGNQDYLLNQPQKSIFILCLVLIICSLIAFKNILFQPTLLLKNFGELSVDPEIALRNNKPTFLEFYAEWCEVCKEMAPKVAAIKKEYENEINFVFLNVDNPKWDIYIRRFNVNGIPQVNLFDSQANLENTLIGKQEVTLIKESLDNLKKDLRTNEQLLNSESSLIKKNTNYQSSPRSHA